MPKLLRRRIAVLLCLVALCCTSRRSDAESFHALAVEVVVGIVAVTAAVTVGVVLVVKHRPSVTGCAAGGPDGMQLTSAGGQTFVLSGETADIKPGDRVRVSGKKNPAGAPHRFVVEKVKDYGPCQAAARP